MFTMKEIWHIALAVSLMRSALFDYRQEINGSFITVLFDITVFTYYIARYLTLRKGPI